MGNNDNQPYALITGGTSGIGFELAKLFAHQNYNLIIVGRNQEELDKTAIEMEQFGVDVIKISKDLFKKDNIVSLCKEIKGHNLVVDVLVNGAGQGLYGEFKDTDIERELDIINLNIRATVMLTKFFVEDMIARNNGKILNLGSGSGKLSGPWQSVYQASKAFVLSFTTAIREELKGSGIKITALMPAVTHTGAYNKAGTGDSIPGQDVDAMTNAADVAKDGYDALMAGKDRVISGIKNKEQFKHHQNAA